MSASLGKDREFALLATATARPVEPAQVAMLTAAAAGGIDWARFVSLAERHRIAPLAFDGLASVRDAIPEHFRATLRKAAMRDRAAALQLVGMLATVTRDLSDAGIEAVSIKGPTLALLAFGDVSLRHCRDLDILIRPEQLPTALTVLQAANYRLIEPEPLDARGLALWARARKDASLRHAATGTLVELHWRLNNNPHLLPDTVAALRQTLVVGSARIETLATDDLLLYLCVHGSRHLWFRLKWLADVHALLASRGQDAIAGFLSHARAHGVDIPAMQMLLLLEQVYGLPLPAAIAAEAAGSWRINRLTGLARRYLLDMCEPDDTRFGHTVISLSLILLRRDPAYVMREIADLLLDLPVALALGGSRWARAIAILGRPLFWIVRKIGPVRKSTSPT